MAVPFDTRLGPILHRIDENYALLKEQAKMHWLISGFERDISTQRQLSELVQKQQRMLDLLAGKPADSLPCAAIDFC